MEYDTAIFYNTIRKEVYLYTPLNELKDINPPTNMETVYRLKDEFPKAATALYKIYTQNSKKHPLNKPIGEFANYEHFTKVPKDLYESITGLKMPEEVPIAKEKTKQENKLEQILEVA